MTRTRLDAHIAALDAPEGLKTVLTVVAATCADISKVVAGGALAGALGRGGGPVDRFLVGLAASTCRGRTRSRCAAGP